LAARIPKKIDYDSLQHLCIDYYEYYKGIYDEGLITEQDLEYRKKLVLDRLPRAIMSNISRLSKQERIKVQKTLEQLLGDDDRFRHVSRHLLEWSKYRIVRQMYALLREISRSIKHCSMLVNQ
jgi:hypothetical protein